MNLIVRTIALSFQNRESDSWICEWPGEWWINLAETASLTYEIMNLTHRTLRLTYGIPSCSAAAQGLCDRAEADRGHLAVRVRETAQAVHAIHR